MDALWIIFVIVAIVFKFLNKAGEVTGEMKERLPEVLREKRLPPDLKDWGFPWDEDNEWDEDREYYTEVPEKRVKSPKAAVKDTILGTSLDNQADPPVENPIETQTSLPQGQEVPGIARHPLVDSASLVNGLILSELLQPPKSKRFGRRF